MPPWWPKVSSPTTDPSGARPVTNHGTPVDQHIVKIVTSQQMRSIEERSEQAGVSTDKLMENAGLAVADRARYHLSGEQGRSVVVLIGPGNNGGDGLVAARHLHSWGVRTAVYLCRGRADDDPNLSAVRAGGATIVRASDEGGLARLGELLESAHMVIDAVLGTGRARPIEGAVAEALQAVASARAGRKGPRLLALDLPTGLDADTGAVDPLTVSADITVSLGHPKVGLYAFPGAHHTGNVETVDIGLPSGLDDDIDLELLTHEWARDALPLRPISAHKGTFGKALVVAGSPNFVGAAYLAGMAAARSGAGLVTLAVPESIHYAVAAKATEPTYIPLPESSPGVYATEASDLVLESLAGYDSLLVGCGMGQAPATADLLERLLYSGAPLPPTVIDADALNYLAVSEGQGWWERLPSPAIVTPHPGEMVRLSSQPIDAVEGDRTGAAIAAAEKWNKVVVLKGAYTVVASPSGRARLSPQANPGLASAGTGDVLAGTITGLLAQGLSLEDGAALGVHIHAAAGARVRDEIGDTGMLASDVLGAIPSAIMALRASGAR